MMERQRNLLEELQSYSKTDYYPFHMPGHKRQKVQGLSDALPFDIDVTEIEGFDHLYQAEGILRQGMNRAANIYGSDKTYFLVNGSTGGILSAICSCISLGGKLLMSRNSHKSAYHGVFLRQGKSAYIYPQYVSKYSVFGGLLTDNIEEIVDKSQDIEAIFVTSPTYEGILVDISAISRIAHSKGIPLIVDEAHGAHLSYSASFPASALDLGADLVIQSLHKTLPSLTQSGVLHVREGLVNIQRLEYYLQLFQSSSPSYVLMAGIDRCIQWMDTKGRRKMDSYKKSLDTFMDKASELKILRVMGDEVIGTGGITDRDPSKLLISTKQSPVHGVELSRILRQEFHLETEMAARDYVLAMTSLMDSQDGFDRLSKALTQIDQKLQKEMHSLIARPNEPAFFLEKQTPAQVMSISQAMEANAQPVDLTESEGCISAQFITVYPPGIPLLVPGERMTRQLIGQIEESRRIGLFVEGMEDVKVSQVQVVKERQNE